MAKQLEASHRVDIYLEITQRGHSTFDPTGHREFTFKLLWLKNVKTSEFTYEFWRAMAYGRKEKEAKRITSYHVFMEPSKCNVRGLRYPNWRA